MNKSLFHIVVVAALGGLLFGFDTGVISGCEQAIQNEFALNSMGTVPPGRLAGWTGDRPPEMITKQRGVMNR